MARVRATENTYLGPEGGGLKLEGEEFDYFGPSHHSLEYLDGKPEDEARDAVDTKYHALALNQLRDELTKRGIGFPIQAKEKYLREKLEADDAGR